MLKDRVMFDKERESLEDDKLIKKLDLLCLQLKMRSRKARLFRLAHNQEVSG